MQEHAEVKENYHGREYFFQICVEICSRGYKVLEIYEGVWLRRDYPSPSGTERTRGAMTIGHAVLFH